MEFKEMIDEELKKQLGDKYNDFVKEYARVINEIVENIEWGNSYPDILDRLSPVSTTKEDTKPKKFYNVNSLNPNEVFETLADKCAIRGGVGNVSVRVIRKYDDEVVMR